MRRIEELETLLASTRGQVENLLEQQQQQQPQPQPQPVEAVSALARLLAPAPSAAAPSAAAPIAEQHKALLAQAYAEQPAWAALFASWRRQQACQAPRGARVSPPVPQARPSPNP